MDVEVAGTFYIFRAGVGDAVVHRSLRGCAHLGAMSVAFAVVYHYFRGYFHLVNMIVDYLWSRLVRRGARNRLTTHLISV